jgi:putative DNA primase/helicase
VTPGDDLVVSIHEAGFGSFPRASILVFIRRRPWAPWLEQARAAALMMTQRSEDTSTAVQLLADICAIFGTATKLWSETIVDELAKMEDRPWPEWSKGKPISKAQLARQLGRFDIVPRTVRIGDQTAKGYDIEQFFDAFPRYLGIQNVTTSQPKSDVGFSQNSKRHTNSDVTFCNPSQPTPVLNCDVVTFSKGVSQEEDTI